MCIGTDWSYLVVKSNKPILIKELFDESITFEKKGRFIFCGAKYKIVKTSKRKSIKNKVI